MSVDSVDSEPFEERFRLASSRDSATLCGVGDSHLRLLEARLGIVVSARGDSVALRGAARDVRRALEVLDVLRERIDRGETPTSSDVEVLLDSRVASGRSERWESSSLRVGGRVIRARTPSQASYLESLRTRSAIFALGPAGVGKTWLAAAAGVAALEAGDAERLILSRPAVEAGERLGFLPGAAREKVDPYLRPLYDALRDLIGVRAARRAMDEERIEIAPLAYMRGRTLSRAFMILDEAQNATRSQLRMFLTRMGEGSRVAVAGDPSQTDLPDGGRSSALREAATLLSALPDVAIARFDEDDSARHPLVAEISRLYAAAEGRPSSGARRS